MSSGQRRYIVVDVKGREAPPITGDELTELAKDGMVAPHTEIWDRATGRHIVASDHPRCREVFVASGRFSERELTQLLPDRSGDSGSVAASTPPTPASVASDFVTPGQVNVTASVLLAVLIVGAGQLANRQMGKAVVLFCAAIALAMLTGGPGALPVWIVGIADAAMIASRLNRGEPVRQWQFF